MCILFHRYLPVVIAWLEEIQAWVTVWAGVFSGNPALNIACNIQYTEF